jgi:hypothetical protein
LVKRQEEYPDLDDLNDSELVLLCNWMGIGASRAWPREELLFSLENFEALDIDGPVDEDRGILSDFLKRIWRRIQMQMSKKVCPNCHECRELQVLECYRKNRKHLGGRR